MHETKTFINHHHEKLLKWSFHILNLHVLRLLHD